MSRPGAPWSGGSAAGRVRSRLPPVAVGDVAPEPAGPAVRTPIARFFAQPLGCRGARGERRACRRAGHQDEPRAALRVQLLGLGGCRSR
eukprot:3114196-Alexandrium_andersonii.AAC.1